MDLGLHVIRFDWPGSPATVADQLARIARTADDAGFTHLSVMDHYFQIGVADSVSRSARRRGTSSSCRPRSAHPSPRVAANQASTACPGNPTSE
ncbi:MAG: hypothetical protein ACJ73E_09375 [Mycobacteriales bacterium]